MTLASTLLARWRALDPPPWVFLLVLFAVFVLPGGIPMTLLALHFATRSTPKEMRSAQPGG